MARLLLFGTPEFAVAAFEPIFQDPEYQVVGVVTQPDKPSGRGMKLQPSPVKVLAGKHNVPVMQPNSLRGLEFSDGKLRGNTEELTQFADAINIVLPVDLAIVVAYGKILPRAILDFPRLGALNVHASLLPRWRGAAPIQRTLFHGDSETGVCLMKLEEGLDTGPVYSEERISVSQTDNFATLHDRLATLGKEMIRRDVHAILRGDLKPRIQSTEGITYAGKWERADCQIRWEEQSTTTLNRIRASTPAPGAWTNLRGEAIKVFGAQAATHNERALPGTVVFCAQGKLIVATGTDQYIELTEIQLPGKTRLPTAEVLKGRSISVGDRFE